MGLLTTLIVAYGLVLSLITPISAQSGCSSSAVSSYQASQSHSQAYSQRYTTRCGWLNWSRCTRYRTRYRTAYMSVTRCCPGFQQSGSSCVDINECSSNPCVNGATCSNGWDSYSCSCAGGWYGTRCQYDVNECLSNPCDNGATCHNLQNAFSCTCTSGWTGTRCQMEIDECESDPCKNGGTCNDLLDRFMCTCSPGWMGTTCETDINECSSDPCFNGGACNDHVNAFSCTCVTGFTGTRCLMEINECNSDPCLNGGDCQDQFNGFTCVCLDGWTGTLCGEDIDECESGPCLYDGECYNLENEFRCNCINGWTGVYCEDDIDDCYVRPCHNGGACTDLRNGFSCQCTLGWTGPTCITEMDFCAEGHNCSDKCINDGTGFTCACFEGYQLQQDGKSCEDIDECVVLDDCDQYCLNTNGSYICSCSEGYTLDIDMRTCRDIDECLSNPCFYGACNDQINSYSCTCMPGWSGFHCDNDIDECSSGNLNACNQTCNNIPGAYTCSCITGYELFNDTMCNDIDECIMGHSCAHICNNTIGDYTCSCHPGYSLHVNGFACLDVDECGSSPCYAEGTRTCYNMENAYQCQCNSGWRGINCEEDVDECEETDLCNQTCSNFPGSFACSCQPGYYLGDDGFLCHDVDECSPNPCQNGALCNNLLNNFSCDCTPGWEGMTCSTDIDECISGPCLNEGTCIDHLNSFSCNCTEGWSGVYCHSGYCAVSPCLNEGTCLPADRRCRCTSLYAGTTCNIIQTADGVPTVTRHPENITTKVSERVMLTCGFRNVHHLDWWLNGKKIPMTRDILDYVIDEMSPPDQGYYSCVGRKDGGPEIESQRALVRIRDMTIYHLKFKLVNNNFTTFNADKDSADYKALVNVIINEFSRVLEIQQSQSDVGLYETLYLHVNDIVPDDGDDGLVVDMRSYVTNSSMTPEDELELMGRGLSFVANVSNKVFDPSLLLVESTVLCPATSWSSMYGVVQFGTGNLNSWTESTGECPWFAVNDGQPIARAFCSGDLISPCAWDPSDNCAGNKTLDQQLLYLQEAIRDGINVHLILSQLMSITLNSADITSAGVTAACNVIGYIGTLSQPTQENLASVIGIMSNLAVIDESVIEEAEMSNSAISGATIALENILRKVNVSINQSFQHVASNLLVQAVNLQSDDVQDGLVFSVTGDVTQLFNVDDIQISIGNHGNSGDQDEAAVVIPPEVIDQGGTGNVAFSVYLNDALFVAGDEQDDVTVVDDGENDSRVNLTINTNVIGAIIGRNITDNLNAPVTISLPHKQQNATNPQCVYWNYTLKAWSRDGCHVTNTTETHTECQCNHLTNFAVLMDVSGSSRRSDKVERVFRVLSYIGCSLSIVGLILTIAVFITDKKRRGSQPIQIILCLTATLLSLYIFFIAMVALDEHQGEAEVDPGLCGVIAGFLHFSTLSSMSWMGIEGLNMFMMVVRVMDSHIPRFMMKASVIAWGLPAVVVILTGAIARDTYSYSDYCFLQKWPLIAGLLIPMAIILIHNVIIFVLVMRRLVLISRSNSKMKSDAHHDIKLRFKNAVSVLLLLGLTWLVGYFTVIEHLNLTVHVFFILLNSLQGFFIFVFYVLRQPQSRVRLRGLVGGLFCCHRDAFTVSKSDPLSMKQTSLTGTDNPVSGSINESALSKSDLDEAHVYTEY